MHSVRDSVMVWCVKAANKKRTGLFDHVIGPPTGQTPKNPQIVPQHDRTVAKNVQRMVWLYENHFYHDLLVLEILCIHYCLMR